MKNNTNSQLSALRIVCLTVLLLMTACAPTTKPKQDLVTKANYAAIREAMKLSDHPGLSFPYKDPTQAVFVHCFGICPWDTSPDNSENTDESECTRERHIGSDIYPVPYQYSEPDPTAPGTAPRLVDIISPADATVFKTPILKAGDNTYTFIVVLKLKSTSRWYVSYSFEPHSNILKANNLQKQNILVEEGAHVKKGQVIGRLVVTSRATLHPSVHISLFYLGQDQEWDALLYLLQNDITSINVSNGTDLDTAGWPWDGGKPDIETTFFCPYPFSSPRAKAIYDNLPKYNNQKPDATVCPSLCAYDSKNGDCGKIGTITPYTPLQK